MAIALVGQTDGFGRSDDASIAMALPACAAGQTRYLILIQLGNPSPATASLPGWTLISESRVDASLTVTTVWYRTKQAADPDSVTPTYGTFSGYNFSAMALSGVDTTLPVVASDLQTRVAQTDVRSSVATGARVTHVVQLGAGADNTTVTNDASTTAPGATNIRLQATNGRGRKTFTALQPAGSTGTNGPLVTSTAPVFAASIAVRVPNSPPSAPGTPTVTPNPVAAVGTIAWPAASDPDGDVLTYDVDLSRDGGVSYARIASGLSATSLSYDFTGTAFTGSARVRVQARDPFSEVGPFSTSATFTINRNPNAPILGFPSGGQSINRATTQRLSWTHSDPDAGDGQSAADLRYRIGTAAYTTVAVSGGNGFRDFAGGTFALGNYEWQVRTYDSLGYVGSYSASGFFSAIDAPAGPTITAPVNGGTIGVNPFTVTWSSADQEAYQLRTVADNAGVPDEAIVYTDTGIVESATDRSRSVAFAVNPRFEHVQVRTRKAGLFSVYASVRAQVSYTVPAAPTVVLTTSNSTASIAVAITNPTPAAGQPTVTSHDLYRREGGVGEGIRIAKMLVAGSTFTDRTVASGVDYSYRAVSAATNGTTSTSAWVTDAGGPPGTPGVYSATYAASY